MPLQDEEEGEEIICENENNDDEDGIVRSDTQFNLIINQIKNNRKKIKILNIEDCETLKLKFDIITYQKNKKVLKLFDNFINDKYQLTLTEEEQMNNLLNNENLFQVLPQTEKNHKLGNMDFYMVKSQQQIELIKEDHGIQYELVIKYNGQDTAI